MGYYIKSRYAPACIFDIGKLADRNGYFNLVMVSITKNIVYMIRRNRSQTYDDTTNIAWQEGGNFHLAVRDIR